MLKKSTAGGPIAFATIFMVSQVTSGAPTPLTTVRVASNLSQPLFVTHAPDDSSRLFIVQQTGQIKILTGGSILPTNFLNVSSLITIGGERGLLGLAFHPQYASNGFFFVDYTDLSGNTVIARYSVSANPDVANPTETAVLKIIQPFSNHNGGWIAFGPDGYLYIAMGDGGDAYDPGQRAQNLTVLLGKMLRIDVDAGDAFPADPNKNYAIPPTNPFAAGGGDGAIWDFGLRNPWRNSFDRLTNDLYIGDVGQDAIEEIDFEPGGSPGGRNYGWDCMEGNNCITTPTTGCSCSNPSLIPPIYTYPHIQTNCSSITGGYVYRGCAVPDLQGTYFFADYCRGQIWSFKYVGGFVTQFVERTSELAPGGGLSIAEPSSFGEDNDGELYICDIADGEVYKIVPATLTDCNHNSVADGCDVAHGTSMDINHNFVPDECELIIPTVSECGAAALASLILCVGVAMLVRIKRISA
ncbi:MAG: PQQ-dependent sugar dehydrogenase [Planctomycetes bacterium]|nr:PQQ-dependent sugar dehydrogenase [Planctomycetota bacterium]